MENGRNNRISAAELAGFCGQVALILESGLPLYDGIELLARSDEAGENPDRYEAVSRGVREKGTLYEALKDAEGWPSYLTEMVGIGERSGRLETVMRGLEEYYSREDRVKAAVSEAVTYPLVLGAMLAAIVCLLLWRVLPVFRQVFASMGMGSGNEWMRIGSFFGTLVLVLAALAFLFAAVLFFLWKRGKKERVRAFLSRVPWLRELFRRMSASRVAGVLSLMLSGGFSTQEALRMAESVLEDPLARERVEQMRAALEGGEAFADAAAKTGLFGELENRMIRMGSAAGREDEVLGKIARSYEERTEAGIARLISVIEPTLVAVLSVVIGAVLLSVILPMAGILGSL